MESSTGTIPKVYPKRRGTSGVRGHLYETKLLSLIYFRAIHDDSIEEFHLATNVDKIGSFDDICFRAKFKGYDKPLAVFLQAKHRENSNSVFTPSIDDLAEYFNGYLEIKRKFELDSKDVLFEGPFSETECFFVIYTTAKGDKGSTYDGSFAKHLNGLIGTGDPGSQGPFDIIHVELREILMQDQITALALPMAKCILGEFNDIQMLMQDELVLQYHVILAQKVFEVSEDQSDGKRVARFRRNFFDIYEMYYLELFKDELCTEILKRSRFKEDFNIYSLLFSMIGKYDIADISDLNETYIIYKNGQFEFINKNTSAKIPASHNILLNRINESQESIRKSLEVSVRYCLPSLEFKVPASFGNKDLLIKGKDERIDRKLNDLTSKIVGLIEQSKSSNIVTIDESMGTGFLKLSGGIASAVGNLLVSDDDGYLKFNNDYDSLGKLAKKLFDKLKDKIISLKQYKFNVTVETFPKLSFTNGEYNNTNMREFFSKLLFYTSQCNEEHVEESLIYEINNRHYDDIQHAEVTSQAIFLKYHDEIQKWSKGSKMGMGTYLEKEGSLYTQSVKHTIGQPLINVIKMMYRLKTKNYTFSEDAVNSIKIDELPSGTVIVTENSAFTVAKLTNYLNNKDCVLLDLEYVLNLVPRVYITLRRELTNTDGVKTVIVVFEKIIITTTSITKMENIAESIKDKKTIIITHQNSVENVNKYFIQTGNVIEDERNRLNDMNKESQNSILETTNVIFQGCEVSLGEILTDDMYEYCGGEVLCKMVHSNKNIMGKTVGKLNYTFFKRTCRRLELIPTEEINVVFHQLLSRPGFRGRRRVEREYWEFYSLNDVNNDVVLIVGDPGIGKSTLLTHLSLRTKLDELGGSLEWILRINLLEYSKEFSEWKDKKTNIDTLESLKFLCKVALSEESSNKKDLTLTLEECMSSVYLKECTGDSWAIFELKMFLNYYNMQKSLIILFDGFDEICPTYANEVLALIKSVQKFPRSPKIWITSRSYDKMNSILELQVVRLYEMEALNDVEELDYLYTFWDKKEILKDLNVGQLENIYGFIMFMAQSEVVYKFIKKCDLSIESKKEIPFLIVFLSFIKFLNQNIKSIYHSASPSVIKALDDIYAFVQRYENRLSQDESVNQSSIPLHLNIIAEYVYNKIIETNTKPTEWDLNTNIFNIYEDFMVTKLKKIRFQEKAQNDMSKPDNISAYEREYADFKDKHKKLAAYAVFDKRLFDEDECKQVERMIAKLKEEEERTGIICRVVNDIPIFVHSTFAEYFAVEYICDLLKSKENQKSLLDWILNEMFFNCNLNVLATLDAKIKTDIDLPTLFQNNKRIIFDLLLKQGKNFENKPGEMKSSLCEAIRMDLRNIGSLLLSTIEDHLDENNLLDFIEIVKGTNMFLIAVKMECEDAAAIIVNHVKAIDETKLILLFEDFDLNENINMHTTDELIHILHKHVWTRMDIVPDWENLADLSGQIYFI